MKRAKAGRERAGWGGAKGQARGQRGGAPSKFPSEPWEAFVVIVLGPTGHTPVRRKEGALAID